MERKPVNPEHPWPLTRQEIRGNKILITNTSAKYLKKVEWPRAAELKWVIRQALEQLLRNVPTLGRYFRSVVSTNHAGMPAAPLASHYSISLYFRFKSSQTLTLSWLIVIVRKITVLMLKGVSQQHIWKPNEVVWIEIQCTWSQLRIPFSHVFSFQHFRIKCNHFSLEMYNDSLLLFIAFYQDLQVV